MDYNLLASLVGHVRLVGMGESTHGSHSFFDAKAQLFKKLVEEHSFTTFMLEERGLQCEKINDYIKGVNSDLDSAIRDLYPVWNIQELKDLIIWCRENYEKYSTAFVGIDINQTTEGLDQRDKLMADRIIAYINDHPQEKAFIWAHNFHIKRSAIDKPMGFYLNEKYHGEYVAIGQFFGKGEFHATVIQSDDLDRELTIVPVSQPLEGTLEEQLNAISTVPYFLTEETMRIHQLDKSFWVRSIGWGVELETLDESLELVEPVQDFDIIIYFPVSTPSTKLK